MTERDARAYVDLTEEELLVGLGAEVEAAGVAGAAKTELTAIAQQWLRANRSRFQLAVCEDQVVRSLFFRGKRVRQTQLVAAVGDVIAAMTIGVTPCLVGTLLVREGLLSFCRERWGSDPDGA